MKLTVRYVILLLLPALLWSGCSRQPVPPKVSKQNNGQAGDEGRLPFNQPKRKTGVSPGSSLIPASTKIPAGTPFTLRLKSSISSAVAHIGDSFEAVLDEAIVEQGEPIIPAGTPVSGKVIALNRSASATAPAYLRLEATSFTWQGKIIPLESSSISAKAGVPRGQQPTRDATGQRSSRVSAITDVPRTVRFSAGQRLTFRLTAPAVVSR